MWKPTDSHPSAELDRHFLTQTSFPCTHTQTADSFTMWERMVIRCLYIPDWVGLRIRSSCFRSEAVLFVFGGAASPLHETELPAWDGAVWNIQQGAQCNYLNSRTQLLHKWAIECRGWTQQASPQRNNGSVSMCVQEVELEERVTGHIIKASEYAVYFGCDGRCGSEWTADDCNCNKIIKYKPSPIFRFIYKAPNHSNIWLRALQQTLQH